MATREVVYTDRGNGTGFLLGVVLLIVFLGLLFYYGLPMLSSATQQPAIQVPSEINVNTNPGQNGQ
jgi:hypothetical protein